MRGDLQTLLLQLKEHLTKKFQLINTYHACQENLIRLTTEDAAEELPELLEKMEALTLKIEEEDFHAGSLYDRITRITGTDRMAILQILEETEDTTAESVLSLEKKINEDIKKMTRLQKNIISTMEKTSEKYRHDADEISRVLKLRGQVLKNGQNRDRES